LQGVVQGLVGVVKGAHGDFRRGEQRQTPARYRVGTGCSPR
jgi:hypothetical protein